MNNVRSRRRSRKATTPLSPPQHNNYYIPPYNSPTKSTIPCAPPAMVKTPITRTLPAPRFPDFLNDSLQRDGIKYSSSNRCSHSLQNRDGKLSEQSPSPREQSEIRQPVFDEISNSAEQNSNLLPRTVLQPLHLPPPQMQIHQSKYTKSDEEELPHQGFEPTPQNPVVLLPPSAFTVVSPAGSSNSRLSDNPVNRGDENLPPIKPTDLSYSSGFGDESSCASSIEGNPPVAPSPKPPSDVTHAGADGERSATSKTFIVTSSSTSHPKSNHDSTYNELSVIRQKLQEFQQMKGQLK